MNTLIVPAYNEAANIPQVLRIVAEMPDFQEIIVVDDGSSDSTAEVASKFGVKVIRLEENQGKGGAIAAGVKASGTPFLTLLDADLVGLQPRHVRLLAQPVLDGEAAMSMGLFASGRLRTDWAQRIAPSITGQRVLRRELLESMPDLQTTRFGVDLALTRHVRRLRLPVAEVILHDLTQKMKEEKLGWMRGTAARMKMYWEIFRVMGK
ncbi:glycosyltransferase family 2 protein [Effusibacillus lacus]|uniref:Glycosyl transferase family 2 n=1 Tax=Effusibacillus lacus TaxID=1348429 RepID=A0A292YNS7_9BACL|nr:glycosyltransferase family 2 protein [Effusibacillus lacus]TCS73158.1 glycosyl transferase family 2 [Effusibacillus lacus]GAX90561.1 glycosyl transferase family 2 [Effusibacillus lacus]